MGLLSGLLAPALGAVGNMFLPGIGGALGSALGTAIGGKAGGGGGGAQAAADPFAGQRGQYQQQLSQMMKGQFTPSDPSYKWRMDQGLEGVNRGAGASGLLRSGNRLAELMNYGQNQASTEYQNQYARLSQLAGANIGSPAAAAQIAQSNAAGSSAYGQQLGGQLVNGIGSLFGGGGGVPVPASTLPPLTIPALTNFFA